ncbi:ORFX [Boe paramyxovirus]|nr:ORFX [Boe paramyxovirus]
MDSISEEPEYANMSGQNTVNQWPRTRLNTFYGSSRSGRSSAGVTRIYKYVNVPTRRSKDSDHIFKSAIIITLTLILISVLTTLWIMISKTSECTSLISYTARESSLYPRQDLDVMSSKIDHILNILSFSLINDIKSHIDNVFNVKIKRFNRWNSTSPSIVINLNIGSSIKHPIFNERNDVGSKSSIIEQGERDQLIMDLFMLLHNLTLTIKHNNDQVLLSKDRLCKEEIQPKIPWFRPTGIPGSTPKKNVIDRENENLARRKDHRSGYAMDFCIAYFMSLENINKESLYDNKQHNEVSEESPDDNQDAFQKIKKRKGRKRYFPWMNTYIDT